MTSSPNDVAAPRDDEDPWVALRNATPARIGLARAGDALTVATRLSLAADHAAARDAVHEALDARDLQAALVDRGLDVGEAVTSAAPDRATYLARPDLGRRLAAEDHGRLVRGDWDLCLVIADGLSARAAVAHAPHVAADLVRRLDGWKVAPVVVATQARVALGDEIGERLGASIVVVLLGERPGLSSADSLGAYVTWNPIVGCSDATRNCVSNIRAPGGLSPADAAAQLHRLLSLARQQRVTGITLRIDDRALPEASYDVDPSA